MYDLIIYAIGSWNPQKYPCQWIYKQKYELYTDI